VNGEENLVQISATLAIDPTTVLGIENEVSDQHPAYVRITCVNKLFWIVNDTPFETVVERINLGRQGRAVPPWSGSPGVLQ
jgi:hypothetical protein